MATPDPVIRDHRGVPIVRDHRHPALPGRVPGRGVTPLPGRGPTVPTSTGPTLPPVAYPPHRDPNHPDRPHYQHPHYYYGDYVTVGDTWWPSWFPYWDAGWNAYWWQLYNYFGGDEYRDYAEYMRDATIRAYAPQYGWL
jgi:hypothetical protein